VNKPSFVYVIYIRSTPDKVWDALTKPEFTRRYWVETWQDSTWESGSAWKLMLPDGRVTAAGEVVEIDRPRRLVLRWRDELTPEYHAEGFSICTIELEPIGQEVKLSLTHEIDKPESEFLQGVSSGWPKFLSSLKSLLETNDALELTKKWPKDF
jgi:uncharacterized protein YndB with AHSA1/START domain